MSCSQEYLAFVLEQLSPLGAVTARRMFGGVGLYADGIFFALIESDTLRFKVDDSNRAQFEACGMEPFKPYSGKTTVMQFYAVPAEVLEDRERLAQWAKQSIQVALQAARAKHTRRRAND